MAGDPPSKKEQLLKLSLLPMETRPVAEMQGFVKSEIVRWGKVVEAADTASTCACVSELRVSALVTSAASRPLPMPALRVNTPVSVSPISRTPFTRSTLYASTVATTSWVTLL